MFASFTAWAGWTAVKAHLRWILPLLAVVGLAVAAWQLVVAPRMALQEAEAEAQAKLLKDTEDRLEKLAAQIVAQAEIDVEKAAATDAANVARVERIERTTVIREAAAARAVASGDPEVSDNLDAFIADIRKGEGR